MRTQQVQLEKAERAARRAGCKSGGIPIFGRSGESAQCRSLTSTIRRMEQNLAQLERRRDRHEGGPSLATRARLMAQIALNGCRDREEIASRDDEKIEINQSRQLNILDQIFDNRSKRRGPLDDENGNRFRTTLNDASGSPLESVQGNYRTLCVRTCDGYYFPVSYSASELDFDRDQKACEALCPGTEVKLYHHKVPDEESVDMVSLAGEPYAELGTAFLYKQAGYKRDKSCGCSPQKNFSIVAGNEEIYEQEAKEEAFVPMPVPRPDPASDPETLANRDGGLTHEVIARILTPAPNAEDEREGESDERKVRVVGPVFLPDPEGAIDLRAPAPPTVR